MVTCWMQSSMCQIVHLFPLKNYSIFSLFRPQIIFMHFCINIFHINVHHIILKDFCVSLQSTLHCGVCPLKKKKKKQAKRSDVGVPSVASFCGNDFVLCLQQTLPPIVYLKTELMPQILYHKINFSLFINLFSPQSEWLPSRKINNNRCQLNQRKSRPLFTVHINVNW